MQCSSSPLLEYKNVVRIAESLGDYEFAEEVDRRIHDQGSSGYISYMELKTLTETVVENGETNSLFWEIVNNVSSLEWHGREAWKENTRLCWKRSTDGGLTWSPIRFIHTDSETAANPTIVTVGDRVVMNYIAYDSSLMQITTNDLGDNWSEPKNLTIQLGIAGILPGPGRGLLTSKGRLMFVGHEGKYIGDYVWYSDNFGDTYSLSLTGPGEQQFPEMDEAQMVELKNGSIIVNMRNRLPGRLRGVARSDDQATTFGPISFDEDLITPICQASILADKSGDIYFSNPDSNTSRVRMTVKKSTDSTNSWTSEYVVNGDEPAAYSCLTEIPNDDNYIGLLYETSKGFCIGSSCKILFVKVPKSFS